MKGKIVTTQVDSGQNMNEPTKFDTQFAKRINKLDKIYKKSGQDKEK